MPYANGCRDCGRDTDGTTRCGGCREDRRQAAAATRAERRQRGACLVCGAAVARTKSTGGANARRVREPAAYCRAHLAYYAARARAS
jgi:hypothetical protein